MNTNKDISMNDCNNTMKILSIDELKYIAIIAMLIDHVGNAFINDSSQLYHIMSLVGRITGPIMFFAAVEGYHHTKSLKKYIIRLLVFALVSYLPFMYVFRDNFNALRLNVIFTILIGVLAIHVRRKIKNIFLKTFIILVLIIMSLPADYGSSCIVTMLVLDYFYGNKKNQIVGYTLIAAIEFGVLELITSPFWNLIYMGNFDFSNIAGNYESFGFLIPIFLFYTYNGKHRNNSKFSKWVFYIFYPLHLSIIAIIRILLK